MKTFIAALLCSSLAFADPPPDAPVADLPGVSVHLVAGAPVPFDGRCVSDEENIRRGKKEARERATLVDANDNGVLLPKPAVALLISGGAAAVIASIVLGIALAAKK